MSDRFYDLVTGDLALKTGRIRDPHSGDSSIAKKLEWQSLPHKLDTVFMGQFHLVFVCRGVFLGAPIDQRDLVRTEPLCLGNCVDRRISASTATFLPRGTLFNRAS